MRKVISYERWSSSEQSLGDTTARQNDARDAWLKAHPECVLETTVRDPGVSGFHGAHRKRGQFGGILDQIESGEIPPGSILLIESFSRFGREDIDQSWQTWRGILIAGIDIVILRPEHWYTAKDLPELAMRILVESAMHQVHRESADKAAYSTRAWKKSLEKYHTTGERIKQGHRPPWLTLKDGAFKTNAHAKTIKKIFKMSLDGIGADTITKKLNDTQVPTFKPTTKQWCRSTVRDLLHDRKVIGEATIRGETLEAYYPVLITPEDFHRVQQGITQRGKKQRGPRGKFHTNLFTGLILDLHGSTYWISDKGKGKRLVPSSCVNGTLNWISFPYFDFEHSILAVLGELNADEFLSGESLVRDNLAAQEIALAALEARINERKALAKEGTSKTLRALYEDVEALEEERDALAGKIANLRVEVSHPAKDSFDNYLALMEAHNTAVKEKAVSTYRSRLRNTICQIVERITLHLEAPSQMERVAYARVTLNAKGHEKFMCIKCNLKSKETEIHMMHEANWKQATGLVPA